MDNNNNNNNNNIQFKHHPSISIPTNAQSGMTTNNKIKTNNNKRKQFQYHLLEPIKDGYDVLEWIDYCHRWFEKCFHHKNAFGISIPMCKGSIFFSILLPKLLSWQSSFSCTSKWNCKKSPTNRSCTSRNPYAEFFDHGCDHTLEDDVHDVNYDDDDDDKDPKIISGCGVVEEDRNRNDIMAKGSVFPTIISLEEICVFGYEHIQRELSEYLRPGQFKNDCSSTLVGGDFVQTSQTDHGRKRMASPLHAKNDLDYVSTSSDVRVGWTASLTINSEQIYKHFRMEEKSNDQSKSQVYSGGFIMENEEKQIWKSLATMKIMDSKCQLPITARNDHDTIGDRDTQLTNKYRDYMACRPGDFMLFPVTSIFVSCICIREASALTSLASPSSKTNTKLHHEESVKMSVKGNNNDPTFVPLPPIMKEKDGKISDKNNSSKQSGPCALISVNGFIFMMNVQIQYHSIEELIIIPNQAKNDDTQIQNPIRNDLFDITSFVSIESCLKSKKSDLKDSNMYCIGRLVKQEWVAAKLKNGMYHGFSLVLSHVPTSNNFANPSLVSPQTITLKIKIRLDYNSSIFKKNIIHLRSAISRFTILDVITRERDSLCLIHSNVLNIALAWWTMAENGCTASILIGGSQNCSLRVSHQTFVIFPIRAGRIGKLGLVDFESNLQNIHTTLTTSNFSGNEIDPYDECHSVDISGLHKQNFLCNVQIDKKLGRCQEFVSSLKNLTGVPTLTICDIHLHMCRVIINNVRSTITPSLVCRITNAKLLSISFCRARVECTECGRYLTKRDLGKSVKDALTQVMDDSSNQDQISFWHLPLPMHDTSKNYPFIKNHCATPTRQDAVDDCAMFQNIKKNSNSKLWCPYDCQSKGAKVRWECSGLLDDGTGQAKLYATNDTALMLLGKGLDVECIERGAWESEEGIIFQKSAFPKPIVTKAVEQARSKILLQRSIQGKNKINNSFQRIQDYLPVKIRAIYELEKHCRLSDEPTRKLDYMCRFKPLRDDKLHLTKSLISILSKVEKEGRPYSDLVQSFSLPYLKLDLVDCFVARDQSVITTAWGYLRSLKS